MENETDKDLLKEELKRELTNDILKMFKKNPKYLELVEHKRVSCKNVKNEDCTRCQMETMIEDVTEDQGAWMVTEGLLNIQLNYEKFKYLK